MDKAVSPDDDEITPRNLRDQLDASRDDLAAGRVLPLGPVLAEIRDRASARVKRRRHVNDKTMEQRLAKPG